MILVISLNIFKNKIILQHKLHLIIKCLICLHINIVIHTIT